MCIRDSPTTADNINFKLSSFKEIPIPNPIPAPMSIDNVLLAIIGRNWKQHS